MLRIKIGCAFFVPFFAQAKKGVHVKEIFFQLLIVAQ